MIGAVDHPLEYDVDWTIARGLAQAAVQNPRPGAGATFIRDDGSFNKLLFGELEAEAWRRGKHLIGLGLKKGDRLAFILPDPDEFVLTFLGAACVGIIPVPIYPPLGMGRLDAYMASSTRIMNIAGARMLLTTKKVAPILYSLLDTVEPLERVVTCDKLRGPSPSVDVEPVTPEDIAFLQFTSGSTSAPKGVVVTHRSLGANCFAIQRHGLEVDVSRDKCLSWLPLYHDMGLIGFVISPLVAGLEAIFMPTMRFIKRPSTWMQAMSDHQATITFAPNFAYGLATRRTRAELVEKMDLTRVKVLGAGAEPNHPGTLTAFLDHFASAGLPRTAMMPVYGMAEATLAMTFTPLKNPMAVDRVDTETYQQAKEAIPTDNTDNPLEFVGCGFAFPDHEVVILDAHGNELGDRHIGEVIFRGPSVADGYYLNKAATAETFRNDGLRTGDLGYLVRGELFITGRKKDLIILNGKNYDPQSIEWCAAEVDGIRKGNVIAFSVPGQHTEELVVVAETRDVTQAAALTEAVTKRVQNELFLRPGAVRLVGPGALPKTTSGKLQRNKCREQYMAGTLGTEGDRTLGNKGQVLKVAKHLTKSTISRMKSGIRSRVQGS